VPAAPVLENAAAESTADERVVGSELAASRGGLLAVLDRAMNRLSNEDRMVVQMHYAEGFTLAHVARTLRMEQKPLYRRIERLRIVLRTHLEDEGVSAGEVRALLDREEVFAREVSEMLRDEAPRDFSRSGIVDLDGRPLTQEDLQGRRIITDVISANEQILRRIRQDPRAMYNLSPREFEQFVAELLEKQGYKVVLTPATNDGGFDMYAARKNGLGEFLYLVECKRYAPAHPVGVDIVRSLYGVVERERASAGVLVTTSRFTKGAIAYQQSLRYRLSLHDYLHLQQMLRGIVFDPPTDTLITLSH
jgi:hypothetical protein